MENSPYLTEIITAVVTAAISWFFARRRNELELTEKAVEIWRKLSTDLEVKYDVLKADNEALRQENAALRGKVEGLTQENAALKGKVEGLRLQLSKFLKSHVSDGGEQGH